MQEIKQQLVDYINKELDLKVTTLQKTISATKESRDSDTKSSMGDKYETGRSMAQMELDKNKNQLNVLQKQQYDLSKIGLNNATDKVGFGSLVKTNQATYFLLIGFGKVVLENRDYYVISAASPIGNLLLNHSVGNSVKFNGKEIIIEEIL